MSQTIETVRHYSDEIQNGRTLADAYEKLNEEVDELGVEIDNGSIGADGIKGEVMDVVNCALDVLFLAHPEITMKQIDALMEAKCRKWMAKYSTRDEAISVEGLPESATMLKEFKEWEVPTAITAQIASISPNSVRRIIAGSQSSRRTQARLAALDAVLAPAFGEYRYGVAWFWRKKAASGATLRELLSAPVVDIAAVRSYLEEFAPDIEQFKSGYQGYKDHLEDDAA
jgi:hypothetical protein